MELFFALQQMIVGVASLVEGVGFNFLDTVIVIVFLVYALEGFHVGFVAAFVDLLSFVASFVIGLTGYAVVGNLLVAVFNIPQGFANAAGFFLAALVSEVILSILFRMLMRALLPLLFDRKARENLPPLSLWMNRINHITGIIPALMSASILLSFLLAIVVALPFSSQLKHAVSVSPLGNVLVANTQGFERGIKDVFGGAVNETINFLTVKPDSDEFVSLRFKTTKVSVDATSEVAMLAAVNKERSARGLLPLVMDKRLRDLARAHARDMFARGYFSHHTPDGLSPFDRMNQWNIAYTHAGENLALAPNTELAMQGLMNSPGHRANILSSDYGLVGIGVIDGGIYGKMFVQEFTN